MKLALSLAFFVCGVLVRTYGKTTTTRPRLGSYGKTSTTAPRGRFHDSMTTAFPKDPSKNDAMKVVEMNATQWVKWRTYNLTDPFLGNPLQCENFKVMKEIIPWNYTLQYSYRSGNSWLARNETMVLEYLGILPLAPNDMFFARTPLDPATDNYVMYSNYVNCTVLRISVPSQGENHCDLWMANTTASEEPPLLCLENFERYCNTEHIFNVYLPNCTTGNTPVFFE
ncbi:uncharacterized protein LOC120841146 [Ixodes scapularis]|uniref:uncharacterized protein LOC120841146 n=1 Tax=Ixodes scapularis TaxID=6945 RepID=UPI001A9ED2F2|nr:uncharacterized protein LOC120841146 [Ixodes scapularis]